MKIISLVDNISKNDLKAKHGLSLYIETKKHKILFDVGPDNTLFNNAKKCNVDLSKVDTVIISHGHMDHGGALNKFLKINSKAKIYIQKSAFEPHYSKTLFIKFNVGLDKLLKTHPQVILVNGDYQIDDELSLFTVNDTNQCHSCANDVLYDQNGIDTFSHEQNLIIKDHEVALIMGCGHCGIVNIMNKAQQYHPTLCIGGYHLYNPVTRKMVPYSLLDEIVQELKKYSYATFYTCHCSGKKAYDYLAKQMDNILYLSCGEIIEIDS